MVSQMVKIGEETGELEKMLGKIADFYEDEVDSAISTLTSIIEPLMMIMVGADGRRDHHLDVPADVQAPQPDQVNAPQAASHSDESAVPAPGSRPSSSASVSSSVSVKRSSNSARTEAQSAAAAA